MPTPLPLLLLFSIRVDLADPDLAAGLQALVRAVPAGAAAAAAAPAPPAPPQQPPQRRPAAPLGLRPRWAERETARSLLPPPISSLRRRPALVRTRTGDGRLVIAHPGEGSTVSGGGLVCTRRREGEGDGQGRLTMRLL